MGEQVFSDIASAFRAIRRDVEGADRRLRLAVRKTARQTSNYVARETVPRAFGELADSVHAEDVGAGASNVVADAPHAAAVENGSRPHVVPLDALIAWVELRGLQGLTKSGLVRRGRFPAGSTTREHAQSVASQLRGKLGRRGAAAWRARAALGPLAARETGTDPATVAIARAIQRAIAKRGTRPHRYMLAAVPEAMRNLDEFVREALQGP